MISIKLEKAYTINIQLRSSPTSPCCTRTSTPRFPLKREKPRWAAVVSLGRPVPWPARTACWPGWAALRPGSRAWLCKITGRYTAIWTRQRGLPIKTDIRWRIILIRFSNTKLEFRNFLEKGQGKVKKCGCSTARSIGHYFKGLYFKGDIFKVYILYTNQLVPLRRSVFPCLHRIGGSPRWSSLLQSTSNSI